MASDPVVLIYNRWRAIEDAAAVVEKQHTDLRADFVRRYGECWASDEGYDRWERDPRRPELTALTAECNDLADKSTSQIDAMQVTPATSVEGIYCKMLVALDVWSFIERPSVDPEDVEYHDTMTVAFLRDAARVLGGRAGG